MARVSFSALIEEIVGKLAGSVFQDSYGGMQIRTRVSPRNPQTNYQQLRRGEFGYISALWRTLTSVQRQTFIDAASTPPAALNLFIQSNVNLSLIEESIIDTYVPSSDPGSMDIEFTQADTTALKIKATGGTTVVPAGTKLLVQVTYLKLPTKIFTNPSQYSPVISFNEGTDLSAPTDILTEWQSRYGIMKADMRLCLKANLIDKSNGLRGADSVNCTNTEDMPSYYFPLFAVVNTADNVGTGNNSLNQITIPANTLIADGDKLRIRIQGKTSSTASTSNTGVEFNGTFHYYTATTALRFWGYDIEIVRTSSTTAEASILIVTSSSDSQAVNDAYSGLDFTSGITVGFAGLAIDGSNKIQCYSITADYIKKP
jgi:hypothetical protein